MKLDRSSMLYGTVILTATGLFCQVLGFLYRIALSRLIGAELMGLYQLIMPAYSVIYSLTIVGLTVAAATLSAEYHAKGDIDAVRQVRAQCLKIFLMLLVPLAVLAALCSDPISVYLLGDARTRLGLVLLLPCLLLTGVENVQKHIFYGVGSVRPPATTEIIEQIIRTAAVLGLLLIFLPQNDERTVGLIALGMVICEVFSAAALTVLFWRRMGRGRSRSVPGNVLRGRIAKIAVPVGATSLLGNLMGSANAVLLPQRLVAGGRTVSEAMSAFGVLSGMTLPLLLLPSSVIGAMCLILVPRLAESMALGAREAVRARMTRVLFITSVAIMPSMALLIVIGPGIGTLLFKEEAVGQFMPALAIGVLLSCYQAVLSAALNGIGKQPAAARNAIISGAVQLAFTVFTVGIPSVGLRGYVAGFVVSSLVGAGLNWHTARRATGIRAEVFTWMVSPALSAILAGLTTNLLLRRLTEVGVPAVWSAVACLAFGVTIYICALSAQGVRLRSKQTAQ